MITQDQVKKLFCYDSNTGILTNRIHRSTRSRAGHSIGNSDSGGYLTTKIDSVQYKVHRVIFIYVYGYLPRYVDHIDGDRLNNKTNNLRQATFSQNQQNTKIMKNNTTGCKGVSWCKKRRMYASRLYFKGKNKHLGYFYDLDVAAQVLRIKRVELHGEYANHG